MSFRLTVPGNLLLAGEYAVLEAGGRGVAVAVEPRLVVTVWPQAEWELVGRWPGAEERWVPGQTPTFAGSVFLAARERLLDRGTERGRQYARDLPAARLELDSSALFDAQGRKRGFGSSAALAVALTSALAQLQGREDRASVHQIAVQAHRVAQGGAGSGYDVTASFFGGLGLFTGGLAPTWQPLDARALPDLAVFAGPAPVRTTRSIDLYRAWKSRAGHEAGELLERSNAAVDRLARSASAQPFLQALADCRALGWELGEAIGSPATLELPGGADVPEGCLVKALGAGNETGLLASPPGSLPHPLPPFLTRVEVTEGVRWE